MFKNYSKYVLSLALAVLLGSTILSGCAIDSSSPGNSPQSIVTQEELGPAIDVKNRHENDLMAIDGVNGVGVGVNEENTPIIYVFTLREGVKGIPAAVEGFQTRTEVIGEIKAFAGYRAKYTNPMWSGVSTSNAGECAAGTIGCIVKKNIEGTEFRYLLSNNHVFARENVAALGEDICQPGRYDDRCRIATNIVADLSAFVPIVFGGVNNNVDAAIAQIRNGVNATNQMAINSYTPTNTPQNAAVNMAVKKTGRTTGLTTGKIAGVDVTINVQYSGGVAKFVNQVWINSGGFSNSGDSGSLIVTSGGTGAHPVCLLFAGGGKSTFANPIGTVLTSLGVTM